MALLGIILLVLCLIFLMFIILRDTKPKASDSPKGESDGK